MEEIASLADIDENASSTGSRGSSEQFPDDRQLILDNIDKLASQPDEHLRENQITILLNLPDNLVEQLRAHLMYVEEEQKQQAKARGVKYEPLATREENLRILRGELLERLTYQQIIMSEREDEELVHSRQVADQALALFQDPERFGIEGSDRNPDLAVIDVHTHEIVKVYDAKMALFDERCFNQVNGFKRSLSRTLDRASWLRRKYSGEQWFIKYHGLTDEVTSLKVADNLERILVVPANRDIKHPENLVRRNLPDGTSAFKSKADYNSFRQQLANGEVKVMQSLFTYDEISTLADLVITQIEKQEI